MKFCPVVPEICRGQVHASQKERIRIIIIKIIRNGAKTISLQTLFGRLNKSSLRQWYEKWFIKLTWPLGWEAKNYEQSYTEHSYYVTIPSYM